MLLGPLVDELNDTLTQAGISIVHMKALDRTAGGWVKVALTANNGEPAVEGALDASPVRNHRLLLNLRASGAPAAVRRMAEDAIAHVPGRMKEIRLRCFSPAPPKPERRWVG
jgi:hypothetical protein